ncbi:MAG TPA: PDZ domain-containing protein, partial [Ktedonobacterales bacterium]|nr:PDZ domain-containing protein [Ktedonobacterales bacterium]
AQRARKFVTAGRFLDSYDLHPQGHSVALTTRGKAFSMANWEGAVLQHGETDGPRYRLARWLADGKRVVALADDGTEPRLVVFTIDGSAPDRVLDDIDVGHILNLRVAPFGSQILLRNHRSEIMVVDVEAGTSRVLDRSDFGRNESGVVMSGIAWSPDAQWVAYSFAISRTQTIIKLCRVETGETYEVTQPVRRDFLPAFDPAGRYLYFLSQREFNPVRDTMQFEFGFPKGMKPYLVTLRRDLPSPFIPALPGSDKKDEPEKDAEGKDKDADGEKDAEVAPDLPGEKKDETKAPSPITIDIDGISSRIVAFPVAEGIYSRVMGTRDGVIFSSYPVEGTLHEDWTDPVPGAKGSLQFYSFEKRKQEQLVDSISEFGVTADGKMLIYRTSERLRVVKAGEKPGSDGSPSRDSGWLDLYRIKVSVRPDVEWRQMFAEAWRLQREQFWVPDMAGVDWEGAFRRYAPLVDRVTTRGELSDLIWELQGELGTSHAYEFGGEYRQHPEYRQGFLGVDWQFDADTGRYIIERIVTGDPWDADATSPLRGPGINVNEGDAVIAINGQRVTPGRGPQQLLVNQAYNQVQLLIQPAAEDGEPRTVTVRAAGHEYSARYRDWVEGNRQRVHEATGNRVGYVHIPDMGSEGFAEFHRYYLTEYDHDGLIIDVRWNGGGEVSGLLLEKLARRRLGYSFQRWGPADPYFAESPRGPLVALTNENAGSDGDIFSHA